MNPIHAFNQPFKRWLLSTLHGISTVHPESERMVSLSSIMLMLVYYCTVVSSQIICNIHPRKCLLNQWELCKSNAPSAFALLYPLLWWDISTKLRRTRQILRLVVGPGRSKQEEWLIGDDGTVDGDLWSYLWSTSSQTLQRTSLPSSVSQMNLHYTSWQLGNKKSQAWNLTASLCQTLKELLMWVVKPQ